MKSAPSSTAVLVFLLLFPACPLFAAAGWEAAVRIFADNTQLHPYMMKTSSKTFDRNGQLEKTEEQVFRLSYENGFESPTSTLILATEDGRDITGKKLKEFEKGRSGDRGGPAENMEGIDKHPLDPDVQNDVTAYDTGRTEYRDGILCSVWDFKIVLNEKYSGVGSAWLNKKTGEAVSIEYRIDPMFPFVEKMNISLDYSAGENGTWVIDRLRMSGIVNFLIMKKGFDSVTSFSDYK